MIILFVLSLFIGVPVCIWAGINFIVVVILLIYTPLLFVLSTLFIVLVAIALWFAVVFIALAPWIFLLWLFFPPDKIFFVWVILLFSGLIFEDGILPTLDETPS